jgi:hypothetical protein
MYTPAAGVATTAAAAGTGLAFTGLNATFDICAAFALLAAGLAVLRIVPRLHRSH